MKCSISIKEKYCRRLRAEDDGVQCSQLVCLDIDAKRLRPDVTKTTPAVNKSKRKVTHIAKPTPAILPVATVMALLDAQAPTNAREEGERLSKTLRKESTGGHHTWVQNCYDNSSGLPCQQPVGQQTAEQIAQGVADGSIPAMDPVET